MNTACGHGQSMRVRRNQEPPIADSSKALTEEPVTPQTFSNYIVDFYSRKKTYRTLKGRDLASCAQSTFPAGVVPWLKSLTHCEARGTLQAGSSPFLFSLTPVISNVQKTLCGCTQDKRTGQCKHNLFPISIQQKNPRVVLHTP